MNSARTVLNEFVLRSGTGAELRKKGHSQLRELPQFELTRIAVVTPREDTIRIISVRRSRAEEVAIYESQEV